MRWGRSWISKTLTYNYEIWVSNIIKIENLKNIYLKNNNNRKPKTYMWTVRGWSEIWWIYILKEKEKGEKVFGGRAYQFV